MIATTLPPPPKLEARWFKVGLPRFGFTIWKRPGGYALANVDPSLQVARIQGGQIRPAYPSGDPMRIEPGGWINVQAYSPEDAIHRFNKLLGITSTDKQHEVTLDLNPERPVYELSALLAEEEPELDGDAVHDLRVRLQRQRAELDAQLAALSAVAKARGELDGDERTIAEADLPTLEPQDGVSSRRRARPANRGGAASQE